MGRSRARVGRVDEIESIRRAIDLGAAGTPSFLVILGEAGIGKTTLLDMAVPTTVPAGAVVLAATGDEAETDLDYGVLDQFLRVAPLPASDRAAFAPAPGTDPLDAGARLLRSLDALELEVPLVLTLDDAHLADAASLQALTFAARRLQRDRVAFVLLGRPEPEARLPPGLLRLAERTAGVLRLAGLTVHEVRQLMREHYGRDVAERAAARLTAHTGGHPLHTRVLLEQLDVDDVHSDRPLPAPRTFSSLLAAQLATCTDDDRRIVVALAVLEQPAQIETAGAVAGVDDPLGAACRLESMGLVHVDHRPGRTTAEFAHALIRAALVHDIAAAKGDDATGWLDDALAIAPQTVQPLPRARLELAAGALLRRAGARSAASRALTARTAGSRRWVPGRGSSSASASSSRAASARHDATRRPHPSASRRRKA